MLHALIHGKDGNPAGHFAALLEQTGFDAWRDESDRYAMQRRVYEQFYLLNQWSGGGSALLADRNRLFDTLAFAATVSPPLFNVAQAHYGVCLATIKTLGTPSPELDKVIADIDSLSSVAAILITEVGVACSHLAVSTRADYDPVTDSFVLTTPDESACKMMANVALDGVAKTGIVFAQLWCAGENRGLFPFVVPLRDRDRVFDGIHIKAFPGTSSMGLDYSLVSFSHVRVPRSHWLQDTATISINGQFHDPFGGTDQRLTRSLGVSRNATTATAVGVSAAARVCIWTSLRYAKQRKSRSRIGGERIVLEFRNQQHLLLGALSETFVISHFARRLVDGETGDAMSSSIAAVPWAAVNRMGALTKAIAVDGAAHVIRNCRRAGGAHGCVGPNQFSRYEDLTDAYSSAAGDNDLILIEIGRDLASSPSSIPADIAMPVSLDHAAALRQLAQFEERRQYDRATQGLAPVISGEDTSFSVWNHRMPALIDLAKAHGRRVALESFLENDAEGADGEVLRALATIYAVENFGALHPLEERDRVLASAFDIVLGKLDTLLDAFGLSTELIKAPIAQDDYVHAYVGNLLSRV